LVFIGPQEIRAIFAW